MPSQLARKAVGLQPLDYNGNVDLDRAKPFYDRRAVTVYVNISDVAEQDPSVGGPIYDRGGVHGACFRGAADGL